MLLKTLTLLLLYSLGFHLSTAQTPATALAACKPTEVCIFEDICNKVDDAGRGLIGPRNIHYCGENRICCDIQQLGLTTIVGRASNDEVKEVKKENVNAAANESKSKTLYKNCDVNKQCVERILCNDGTINDSGRYIISSVGVRIADSNSDFVDCHPIEKCCNLMNEVKVNVYQNQSFAYKGCGYSNPNGIAYKLEGYTDNETNFGEYPWMIAILGARGRYVCGGTLIHPSIVLTAAHCVQNHTEDTLVLRAGEWDTTTELEPLAHQNRRVRRIILHENYDDASFFNDLALLVVEEPFVIDQHIQPICLPDKESPALFTRLRHADCYATGWGRKNYDNDGGALGQALLKSIDLPIVAHDLCEESLRGTILGRRFKLRPSFLCAGGEPGKDTCKGDGGSPLFCSMPNNPDRYELAGLVSWGISCGNDGIPGVYVNIPHLREWIDNHLTQLKINVDKP